MAASRRRRPDISGWPTRERILVHASHLFATRGYLGTSTRDIAAAVGIQQPSLYSHFPSKQAIAEELLRRDLTWGNEALEQVVADGGGAAVELYRYLHWEVTVDLASPFDLRALYLQPLLDQPEFVEGRRLLKRYSTLLRSVIQRGIDSGELAPVDVAFAARMIDATVLEAMRAGAMDKHLSDDEADLTASFLVRALLADPGRIEAVRREAHRLGPPADD